MKNWILYLVIVVFGFGFQNRPPSTKWVVVSGCWLKVDGSTNVNNFSCAIPSYSAPDTISIIRSGTPAIMLNGNIKMPVQNFDCHNPVMTADLRKTLKVKEYPHFIIRFLSMASYPDAMGETTKGMVVIDLAGVSRKFEVDYKVVSASSGFLQLEGSRKVSFSDFQIAPPSKLGGMIRTKNELTVVFNLRVKTIVN
jgi:hypothetical protein